MTDLRPRLRTRRLFLVLSLAAVCYASVSCGPELTEPSRTDVTGTWFAAGPAAGLTNITVVLQQAADGTLTGTYEATGTTGLQFCPATGPCTVSGKLTGSNSVLQVFFYLTDAGSFGGQLESASLMRGAMSRINRTDPITFVSVFGVTP